MATTDPLVVPPPISSETAHGLFLVMEIFPEVTLAPERGLVISLAPLVLAVNVLKEEIGLVEVDQKANDPAAEIAPVVGPKSSVPVAPGEVAQKVNALAVVVREDPVMAIVLVVLAVVIVLVENDLVDRAVSVLAAVAREGPVMDAPIARDVLGVATGAIGPATVLTGINGTAGDITTGPKSTIIGTSIGTIIGMESTAGSDPIGGQPIIGGGSFLRR